MAVFRCFSEKRKEYDPDAGILLRELRDFLGVRRLNSLRILNRYDVEGISPETYNAALKTVFSEPQTDEVYDDSPPDLGDNYRTLIIEALPGQFDQRADSCAQCLCLLEMQSYSESEERDLEFSTQQRIRDKSGYDNSESQNIVVKTAKMYVFYGNISESDFSKIRSYLINHVESREASPDKPERLAAKYPKPEPVGILNGFIAAGEDGLPGYIDRYNLAMDMADLRFMQVYFRDTEKRDPTIAELRVIDTYWSDHCRHTTFLTHLTDIAIDDPDVQSAYDAYLCARNEVYGTDAPARPQTLMDLATIAAKTLRKRGLLENIDSSEEVNACSIRIDANVNGKNEEWLLMFKNETHNHPTEVEPFGGASTCVGGAIRDPLSGRSYVYQAMRVTGAGDPNTAFQDTIPGKLPQRKLTRTAAQGNSSYGNQIGLAGGFVHEIYHPGYVAKRMELGALVGAVKAENVRRAEPAPGDKVILLGGRTGRDGIGGATGSSKSQSDKSIVTMAAEVQKGDAPEERKIQRLFLDPDITKIIKKCNDFGAGGVSVAVGELADGLDINLSLVRCKYDGLDGTELAISESQERMAVVIAPENVDFFINKAARENLEAYEIAEVTKAPRMVMRHNDIVIVDLSREFLSTNGAVKTASVRVPELSNSEFGIRNSELSYGNIFRPFGDEAKGGLVEKPGEQKSRISSLPSPGERLRALVSDLRFCSQRGIYEMFDGTAGASAILMKNGGKTQSTPIQAMASLLPVGFDIAQFTSPQSPPGSSADTQINNACTGSDTSIAAVPTTTTCSVMAYGFDPYLSSADPFIGAKTAVVLSVAKLVAAGCRPDDVYLSFQEFFEDLRHDPERWGKPFSALLGAFQAQMGLDLAAIGGKDSMSGSFNEMDVPPALVSFAVAPNDAAYVISPEFKQPGNDVVVFYAGKILSDTKDMWRSVHSLIKDGTIVSAWAAAEGGIAEGIFKMSLGNDIGFDFSAAVDLDMIFSYLPGAIIAEVSRPAPGAVAIGSTLPEPVIKLGGETIGLAELKTAWEGALEPIFPVIADQSGDVSKISNNNRPVVASGAHFGKPNALILTFPGSNGEIDAARAVQGAGGVPEILIIKNKTQSMLAESIITAGQRIRESQIIILPGGPSLGDEPDGPAKFINLFLRVPSVADALRGHLHDRGGLILGIGNGFQALIKLGLVPFGEITDIDGDSPALARNIIGRHQAGYVYTRVASVNSPWMSLCSVGDIHALPISNGAGRFTASDALLNSLSSDGRIATQYSDVNGAPSMDILVNPSGSVMAVEGLFSPDGKVFGKMGHSERRGQFVAKNIYGDKHQPIFEGGINYFK